MASVQEIVQKFETGNQIPVSVTDITVKTKGVPSADAKKVHISKFLVLVNSNVKTDKEEDIQRISTCLKTGFKDAIKNHETEIFKIKDGAEGKWSKENIFSIGTEMVTEVGSKEKRVHLHALVTVKHNTLVQMNAKGIRTLLEEKCQDDAIKRLFVRIRFVPVSDFAELYLRKAPV